MKILLLQNIASYPAIAGASKTYTIASNVGGLPGAKLGVDYVLPVNPIVSYGTDVDENGLPVPEIPPQPVERWRETLLRLLENREEYAAVSLASRTAALAHIARSTVQPFEQYLFELSSASSTPAAS